MFYIPGIVFKVLGLFELVRVLLLFESAWLAWIPVEVDSVVVSCLVDEELSAEAASGMLEGGAWCQL